MLSKKEKEKKSWLDHGHTSGWFLFDLEDEADLLILHLVLCSSDFPQSSLAAMVFLGGKKRWEEEEFSSENLGFRLSFTAHYLGHLNLFPPPQSSHLCDSW